MKKAVVLIVMSFWIVSLSIAGEAELATIKTILGKLMPNAEPDSVTEAAIPGMYEAIYGAQVVYISADGRYMIEGDIYDIKNRVNVTESKRQSGRIKAVNTIDNSSMIVFSPKSGKVKHTVTAFTDVDCGYCRKMHGEMAEYNSLGIEFRYLAYPRAGLGSESYQKAEKVWCAVDRKKAMNFAKSGAKLAQLKELKQVEGTQCSAPIRTHMSVGKDVGVSGTPTLVMESGQVLPGYVPAQRLIKILDQDKKS